MHSRPNRPLYALLRQRKRQKIAPKGLKNAGIQPKTLQPQRKGNLWKLPQIQVYKGNWQGHEGKREEKDDTNV